MRQWLLPVSNALRATSNAALWLAGVMLVVMTVIVAYQVFMRYVVNASPSWTEGTAIMLMSWFIFLGAAVGVRENFHMGFDVLTYVLPPRAKGALRTISDLAVFAFAFGMVYYGGLLAIRGWGVNIPVLHVPQTMTYLPIVISGFLMCLYAVERILRRLAGEPIDEPPAELVTEA
ncbi:TRAP-type C4-dicarboxylate transport system, small permease component [Devosia lucknowensis]|uniref:TRAP transporter small permease protein n=1 Tax=Devosia lucknowensis TaxID=1096929 RepID=A0A1Y6FBY7_9HYPH|nr:TRAP-type C4-dicarboxylate transport system, small permease component [Devosia lucknowensis]